MAEAGHEGDARRAWMALDKGRTLYQIPVEIPCDRSFAFPTAEVEYMDKMASHLFGTVPVVKSDLPVARLPSLYVHPAPFPLTNEPFNAQKVATTVMRMRGLGMTLSD